MSTATRSRRLPGATLLAEAKAADRGEDSLAKALRTLTELEDAAAAFERTGNVDDAVDCARIAANFASFRHPGVHVSLRLEGVLARIGAALPALPARPAAPTGRVLHIASETYAIGGHTRMLWRWIERDREHTPTVALTAQAGPVPDGLIATVAAAGGKVLQIGTAGGWLARAQALRELAAGVDAIVLHAHPMDPLPVLAFAGASERPPIIYFNHADHVFWLGASIADVVHSIRPLGAEIAGARGIAAERRMVTVSPVIGADGAAQTQTDVRAGIREQLGAGEDAVVLFSAGSHDKYCGPAGLNLIDLVGPVLQSVPEARLVVAGATADEHWEAANARHPGQIVVLGPQPGLAPLYAAADVYLESRPLGGPGASSEAAMHGLPVLTHAASAQEAAIYCTDDRYGATLELSAGEYRRRLLALIRDPEQRATAGANARDAIAAADATWERDVRDVYRIARELPRTSLDALAPEPASPVTGLLVAQGLRSTHPTAAPRIMGALAGNLRYVAPTPALRGLWDGLDDVLRTPQRTFEAVVALPGSDRRSLAAVILEFRRLHILSVSPRFVIGLRPDQVDAAIPFLGAALADDGYTVDVVVDEHLEALCGPRTLELIAPGHAATGRAPAHVCADPPAPAPPERHRRRGKRR